jgi:hypothetical protein
MLDVFVVRYDNWQKLNATANAFGAPIRPRHLVPTQQGVETLAPNDLTPCRMAFYFVSTFYKNLYHIFLQLKVSKDKTSPSLKILET